MNLMNKRVCYYVPLLFPVCICQAFPLAYSYRGYISPFEKRKKGCLNDRKTIIAGSGSGEVTKQLKK
jgi:hypothetical protein